MQNLEEKNKAKNKYLVSLVYAVRNDNYTELFLNRFDFVLKYTLYVIRKLNLASIVEVIVVDWGSDKRVMDALSFGEESHKNLKFVIVQESIANRVSPEFALNISMAMNCGIRRALGQYVCCIGSDQFFTLASLKCLCTVLEKPKRMGLSGMEYMIINRRFLENNFWGETERIKEYEQFFNSLNISMKEFVSNKLNLGTGVGGMVLRSDLWHRFQGFCESFGGYGANDFEIMSRISNKINHIDLTNFGVFLFKLPRTKGGSRLNVVRTKKKQPLRYFFPEEKIGKNPKWGLGSESLPIINAKKTKKNNKKFLDPNLKSKMDTKPSITQFFIALQSCTAITHFFKIKVTYEDIVFANYLTNTIRNGQIKTIWFDHEQASRFLLYLASIFKDLSFIIFDSVKDANGNDFDIRSRIFLMRSIGVGHYGRINCKRVEDKHTLKNMNVIYSSPTEIACIFSSESFVKEKFLNHLLNEPKVRLVFLRKREKYILLKDSSSQFVERDQLVLKKEAANMVRAGYVNFLISSTFWVRTLKIFLLKSIQLVR